MNQGYTFTDKLIDPLSPATRKARRSLLGVGLIGIAIAKIKLLPSRIAVLGIEFTEANQEALISVLILIILYYTIITIVYLCSEILAWQIIVRSSEATLTNDDPHDFNHIHSSSRTLRQHNKRESITYALGKPTFIIRLSVESILPIAVGIYAIVALSTVNMEELSARINDNEQLPTHIEHSEERRDTHFIIVRGQITS